MRSRWLLLPALGAVLAPAALAATGRDTWVVRSFSEDAKNGLAVSKPLDGFVATSRVRVVAPTAWRPEGKTGRRFLEGGTTCAYRMTFTARTRLDAPGDAADRAATALPSPGPAYRLDSGERRSGAFRVVRIPRSGGVRVDGFWNGVLTRRQDIVPQGRVAWSELRVTASSRPGDECHSGTYRDVLGPQMADALATARATLRFVKKP